MIRFSVLLVAILLAFNVSGQRSLTLEQAIQLGIQENKAFDLKQLDVAIAETQINELKATGLPQVTGGVGYQYYFAVPQQPIEDFISPTIYGILGATDNLPPGFQVPEPTVQNLSFFQPHNLSVSIDASWLVFDGSYLVGLEAAKLYRKVASHSIQVSEQEVKNNVTKAYLNVLLTDINSKTLADNIASLEKIRYETQAIYNEGFVEQLDVDRLDLSLMNLRTEFEKLTNVAAIAMNVLKLQIGIDVGDSIVLTEDIETLVNTIKLESIDLEEQLNLENLAEYQQIEYGIQLQELNNKQLQKSKLPSVSTFLSASETLQRENLFDSNQAGWLPSVVAGVNVSVPIYDGNRRKSQSQKVELEIEKIQVQKEQYMDAKEMEVANAKLQFLNARKTLENTEAILEITRKIYDKTLIKYKEGVGSSVEVTQAESDVFNAQSQYINAIYTVVNAKTDLDIALGTL